MVNGVSSAHTGPILRIDGEGGPVDLVDLEEDVRWGRVSADAELLHPPWTGRFYLRLAEIPQLRDALDAPAARLAARLRSQPFPAASIALGLLVFACALVQTLAPEQLAAWEGLGRVGWDAVFLNGQWWGGWTAHLLHWDRAPLVHAFANLTFILYCGMRVEQAWGVGGLLRVVAGAMAGGAIAVMLLSDLPVVGSSMIAFGLIGAQIAIGFRMDEAIPRGWRGRYGWGNLLAVLLIFSLNKLIASALTGGISGPGEGVSHIGHTGGLLGGVAAVLVGTPAVLRPGRQDALAVAAWLSLPAALALLLPLSPQLVGMQWHTVEVEEADVSAVMPTAFRHPASVGGLRGRVADPNTPEPFFLDRAVFSSYDARDDADWGVWWARELDPGLSAVAPPPALEGWRGRAWESDTWTVVEYQQPQGVYLIRAGWAIRRDEVPELGARERLYRHILPSVSVGLPALLVEEAAKHGRNPASPDRQYRYAYELWRAGQADEADALLSALVTRSDGWEWDGARLRLQLLLTAPPSTLPPAGWVAPFLDAPITDMAIHRMAIRWLAEVGDCAAAQAHSDRVVAEAAQWTARNPDMLRSIAILERGLAEASAALARCSAQ